MSIRARSTSYLLAASVALGVAGCIDVPQLNGEPAASTPTSSNDPTTSGAAGGGSAISHEHDGMVLVPAVMLTTAGVAPTAVNPAGKDQGGGDGNAKPPKGGGDGKGGGNGGGGNGGGNGGGGNGGGGGGGNGGGGGGNDAGAPPAGGTTGGGGGTPAPTQVAVASFWLDATEVTVAAYRACIASGACTAPTAGPGCTLAAGLETHPVSCVTANQSRAYCTSIGKRLVRNDEWTAAAAGGTGRVYPWGAEPPTADRLDACGPECAAAGMYATSDGYVATAPTGSFPLGRSPDGADDLAGNVAEWVDGALVPLARGGSYADVAASSVASATAGVAATPGPTIGFRCAADR